MRTALFSELSETDTCIKVTILIFTDFAGKLSDFLSKSTMCNPGEDPSFVGNVESSEKEKPVGHWEFFFFSLSSSCLWI